MKKNIHMFFHEAGHAIDYAKPHLETLFKNNRNKKFIRTPIYSVLLASLIIPENHSNDKKKTPNQKFSSFIKNHCGILSTIGFIPMLICEISANKNGQKLAKKYANKIDRKLLTKTHTYSTLAYLTIPAITGISVSSANKIRDKIAQKLNFSSK